VNKPLILYMLSFACCLIPRLLFVLLFNDLPPVYSGFFSGPGTSGFFPYPGYLVFAGFLKWISFGVLGFYIGYHLLFHALIGPIVLAITRRLRFDRLVQWLSVVGVALMPYYVSLSGLQPQAGVVVVIVGFLIFLYVAWFQDLSSKKLMLGLPFFLVIAIFFRPGVAIVMGGLYGMAFLVVKGRYKVIVFCSGLVFIGMVLLICGLNWGLQGHFGLPIMSHSGKLFYVGNNEYFIDYVTDYSQSTYVESLETDHPFSSEILNEPDPLVADRMKRDLAVDYIRSNPKEFIKITVLKFLRYWDFRLDDADSESFWKNMVYTVPYLTYGTLAVIGFILLLIRKAYFPVLLVSTVFGVHSVLLSFIFTSIRYRMTFEFLLIILASVAVGEGYHRIRSRGKLSI